MKIYGFSVKLHNSRVQPKALKSNAATEQNCAGQSSSTLAVQKAPDFYKSDLISFGTLSADYSKRFKKYALDGTEYPKSIKVLKDLHDVPCVYCGQPVLTNKERKRFVREISPKSGEELIHILKSPEVRKYLRNNKPNIAESICRYAKLHPKLDLQQILRGLVPNYVNQLEMDQIYVLSSINKKFLKRLESYEAQYKLKNFIDNAYMWIKLQNSDYPFKRKAFIEDLKCLLEDNDFNDKVLAREILNEALKMPKSFENESAFIVKYSRRASSEIAWQLFYEAASTIEHVKPQSENGQTVMSNLAIADAYCNNYKRRSIPMDEFYEKHPNMKKSIEKNLDRMLKEGFSDYVSDLAETYMQESQNKIDLTRYTRKEPKNERKW